MLLQVKKNFYFKLLDKFLLNIKRVLNMDIHNYMEIFLVASVSLLIGFITLLVYLIGKISNDFHEFTTSKPKRKSTNQETSAKNSKTLVKAVNRASARNDVSDYQKIKTSQTILPVIKATVLNYGVGELGESFSEPTRLYYSPEALADKEFLESVIRSPWQVETHEKNTGEFNRSVDGWANESWFDEKDKTVYAKGFLIGEDNIDYAKENINKPSFGTSAFISFLKIDREKGTTPEGLEYDAVARKAVCNHVAILPNIRDEKNKIVSINAKNALVETQKITGVKNTMEQSEFNSMMENYEKEKNSRNVLKESIKNEIMEEMKASKNEDAEKKEEPKKETANEDAEKKEEPKKETANEDAEKKEEPKKDEAANALPSETLVKTFSEHLGVRFAKTPSIKELADFADIPFTTNAKTLTALNAKAKEISTNVNVTNSKEEKAVSISDALKEF